MNKICIYAICKNELQFVDKWYESMSEADLIVVLDTGSTDGTYERFLEIQKTGATPLIIEQKVITPWRFDVARNESLDLVPSEYNILVCTDLDELLDVGWSKRLREEWIEGVHERADYMYAWSHTTDMQPARVFTYNKVHSRKWRWRYPVHELLYNVETNSEEYDASKALSLGFDMYLHHYPVYKNSRTSYLPLLQLRASEDKNDYYGLVYLAHEYYYQNMYEESIDTLKKCASNTRADSLTIASCYLFMGDAYSKLYISEINADLKEEYKHQTIISYLKAIKFEPTYREPYLNLAAFYLVIDDYNAAIDYVHRALNNSYKHYSWLERDNSWTYQPFDILSLAYFYRGDKIKSLACAYKAALEDTTNQRLRDNINNILSNINDNEY